MRIYEYIQANGPIFVDNDFTSDTQLFVNRMLKFNYRDKPMMYDTPADVAELVAMAMYDNKHKYETMLATVAYSVPADYTNKVDTVFEKLNTGTQAVVDAGTKVNTGTVGLVGEGTRANTGTQVVVDEGIRLNTGTVGVVDSNETIVDSADVTTATSTSITQPITVTDSEIGFDGGALLANKTQLTSLNSNAGTSGSTVNTDSTTNADGTSTTTNNLTEDTNSTNTRTDNLTEALTNANTRTDNLNEVTSGNNTRTDDLAENSTNGVKTEDVPVKIEALLAMYDATSKLLYRIIAEDLVMVLCERGWE